MIEEYDPDAVISTYPGVTAVLGMLRENRRLDVPVQSAITDLAGLRYWAHPGVDLHYVTHPESIEEVERLVGPGTVEWVRPPISREFLMPRTRRDAREALDVPAHARVVLVSGGGWGIGDLEGAIRSALSEDALVVCITGRNDVAREKLERSFAGNEQVRILGFTEQMSDWMAAADAMIHATAGLTVLEAHIRGCPVVSYGFSAGHLRANNAAFERFGLAEVAGSQHELESVLRHLTRERRSPDSSFASLPSIASRALNVRPRVRPQPVWRLRAERVATAVTLAVIAVVMLFTVIDREAPYKVIAKPLEGRIHIGKDNDGSTATPAASVAPAAPCQDDSRPAGLGSDSPLIRALARGWSLRRRGVTRRPGAGAARPGPRARRWGSPTPCRAPTASPSPSMTAHIRRAPQRCWRHCASAAPRPPSSSPASRSSDARHWRRRSSPRATGSSCTAIATATCCDSAWASSSTTPSAARAAIEEASGQAIADYRPPYGIFSAATLRAVQRRGWRPLLWSRWGKDWARERDCRARSRVARAPASRPATSSSCTMPTTTARAAPGCVQRRRCRRSSMRSRPAG